jgi:lysophospholipase L1-like esterase
MTRNGLVGVVTLVLSFSVLAAEGPAVFQDGERVCFIGDSITHGDPNTPDYHELIYLYYLTRFPDRKIAIFDRGISGDSAQGAIQRFKTDMAPCHATVSTIMLGMNDVGRPLYEGSSPTCTPEVQAKRDARLKLYREKMEALCRLVVDSGSRLVLLTPSPYDQVTKSAAADLLDPGAWRVNDGLVRFSEAVRELAKQFNAPVVDMNGGTLAVLERLHQKDPTRALCARDRVHPNVGGHWVMAYLFLKGQNAPAVVSAVTIDAAGAKVVEQVNGAVSELAAANGAVRFILAAKALPFPTDEVGPRNVNIVPFMDEFNRETLRVTSLRPGAYTLGIDGVAVGDYDAAQLAAGVNLAENLRTPQHRQATQVAAVNRQRDNLSCKLRGLALIEFTQLNRFKGDKTDMAKVRAFFDEVLAGMEGKSWHPFFKGQFDNYLRDKPEEAKIQAEIAGLEKDLYQINQPKPHRYELTRTGDVLPPPAAETITEPKDLAFHLPFDKSPAAASGMPACAPGEPVQVSYEAGPVGDAVVIAGKQGLSYPEPESFPLNESSISFWIKTHWDPQDAAIIPYVFRKAKDGLPVYKPGNYFNDQEIRFVSHGQPEKKVKLVYHSTSAPGADGKPQTGGGSQARWIVSDWGANQWRHICITVGNVGLNSKNRMYVQGELVNSCAWDTPPQAHAKSFTLGGGEHAMSMDDFRAYSRALTAEEVYELYRLGARRAEFLNRQ